MDYTTLANVKKVIGAEATTDDDLLSRMITEASRAIDIHCAGRVGSTNYFELLPVSGELLTGDLDSQGRILCRPRKPLITSVESAEYRLTPMSAWQTVDSDRISIDGYSVLLWEGLSGRGRVQVRINYTGGFASTPAGLPGDIVNVADLLSVRFYKEAKSGLSDAIGVAEFGTMQYTKALPARVIEMLKPYKRMIA